MFIKESLHEIQDTMRIYCKESFNKIYETNMELLEKLEGRNEDIEYIQYGNYSKDNDDFDMNR